MQIIKQENIQQPVVATIGFFDGVHSGHRFLIEQVKRIAKSKSQASTVITFPEHPRMVLNKDYQPALLCSCQEKLSLLADTGIDYCILLDFTLEISRLSAKEFMQKILKDRFNVNTLIIGYDHKFGKDRQEGFEDYKMYGEEMGIEVIQACESNPDNHVSSSRIRKLLSNGEIRTANELLSYRYQISGKVIEGFKIGRSIGFPTANLQVTNSLKLIPKYGVYAVKIYIEDTQYNGMLYIGKRATLHSESDISLEVNIFDFEENLYEKEITIEFIDFIREDKKFPDIDSLKNQLSEDKKRISQLLKKEVF